MRLVPKSGATSRSVYEGAEILWVDDRPSNNRNESRMLRSFGAIITFACTTDEARDAIAAAKVEARPFDLLLSDISRDLPLPPNPMAGLDMLAAFRKEGIDTPLVFYVGSLKPSLLNSIGQTYHDHRAHLMVAANEGMTKTYNRFHDAGERSEPIRILRDLHDDMDRAVLRAYGWDDLANELRPEFLTEETEDDHIYQGRYFWPSEARDLVLSRLLTLNAQRHDEEVAAGLAPAGRSQASDGDEAAQARFDL